MGDKPRGFFALLTITLLVSVGLAVVAPVLPEAAERYELSNSAAALLLSSFAAGRLLFTWPSGYLADRFPFGRVALVSTTTVAVCASISAMLPPFSVLLIAQTVQGMASTLFTTGALNHLLHAADRSKVGRLIALFQGLILAGYSFSPLIGGAAGSIAGLRGPFYVSVIGGITGMAVVTLTIRNFEAVGPRSETRSSRRAFDRAVILSRPIVAATVVGFAGRWMLGALQYTLFPLFASNELGFSPTTVGAILTGGGLAMLVSLPVAGRWIDHRGRRPAVRIGMAAIAVTGFGYAAIGGLWTGFVFVAASGLARGLVSTPPPVIAADVSTGDDQGSLLGFVRLGPELGGMLGPAMGGFLLDQSSYTTACLLSVVFLGALAAFVWNMPETKTPAAVE